MRYAVQSSVYSSGSSHCNHLQCEEEAAELASRQSLQLDVIEQISTQIGFYQQRAADAGARVDRETFAAQEREKEILALQGKIEELQLQLSQSNRLSSLINFNSESASREAENARTTLLQGLSKLLDNKGSVKTVEELENLEVNSTAPTARSSSLTSCLFTNRHSLLIRIFSVNLVIL